MQSSDIYDNHHQNLFKLIAPMYHNEFDNDMVENWNVVFQHFDSILNTW